MVEFFAPADYMSKCLYMRCWNPNLLSVALLVCECVWMFIAPDEQVVPCMGVPANSVWMCVFNVFNIMNASANGEQ